MWTFLRVHGFIRMKTTKFYKAKKVVGMDKWEKTTDPNYNEKDCYLVYFNGLTKFNDLYGRVASNAPLGYFRVLASDCTPVTDVIGGVISTLFANIRHLLSREVVAC